MSADAQILINLLGGALAVAAGWLFAIMHAEIRSLRTANGVTAKEQVELERRIAADYARRDDVKDMVNQVLTAIERIDKKLDQKQDKE